MWTVYKHTSPSGKVYIGITGRDVNQRWVSPLNGYKNNPAFCAAIKKYGWENIKHEILFKDINKISAKLIEIDLIFYYKKCNICYNITDGGEGFLGLKHDEKWMTWLQNRNRANEYSVGKQKSDETKNKIREKLKQREIELKKIWLL